MSVNTIPVADSDSLFTVTLDSSASIRTTVTASSTVVAAWISDVLAFHSRRLDSLIVGLDCEWRPSFSRQQNPIALLQLCVGRRCLLFQILHSDSVPLQLLAFLCDPRFKFVGVGIDKDVEKLIEDYEISVKNAVDLKALAAERMGVREAKKMGLKKLAEVVMGVEVEKPKRVTMSRWDQAVLMLDQIGYACVDAFLSFEIGRRLFAESTMNSDWLDQTNFGAIAEEGRTLIVSLRLCSSRAQRDFILPQKCGQSCVCATSGTIHPSFLQVNTIPFADSDSLFTVILDSAASIRTTVTASSTAAASWISDILAFHSRRLVSVIVGLDCKRRPSFSSRQQNPIALLQLCVGRRCLLFQLLHSDSIPAQLLAFLSDPRFKFVGVGIDENVEKLIEDYEISVKNAVDLRALVAETMVVGKAKQMGLKKLAEVVLGIEVEKPMRVMMSRWDQAVLMLDQIGHASVDAFLSFEIGRRLFAESPMISG